jgi:peroxiredoxin Q/BCP
MTELNKKAPDFTLMGSDRKEHSLHDYLGKKVILYFYPRDNTPGCTLEAEEFRDKSDTLSGENAVILGISRDSLDSHDKFIEKLDLPFTLLSDEDSTVCTLYDVLKEKNLYGKKSIGIQRSTFIIDEEGILIYENRKVKAEGHAEEITGFIKEARSS